MVLIREVQHCMFACSGNLVIIVLECMHVLTSSRLLKSIKQRARMFNCRAGDCPYGEHLLRIPRGWR